MGLADSGTASFEVGRLHAIPGKRVDLRAGPTSALASALLPGAGQALQDRWWTALAFGAVEVGAWLTWREGRHIGRDARRRYRELADRVARTVGGAAWPDDFDYVERMSYWVRSGRFDVDPGRPGIQPERDPLTWNGAQWRLAANLHLGGDAAAGPNAPGWSEALAWYEARAYGDADGWDWRGSEEAQSDFRRLIRRSDDGFRQASLMSGIVLANHLVAPLEAWLRRRSPVSGLGLTLLPDAGSRGNELIFLLSLTPR